MSKYQLIAKDITKVFNKTVVALDKVSCTFVSGTVHAVIGKNGSGKSTLIKIIAGVYDSDEGEIYLYDKKIEHNSPIQALKNGIATVYQELSLVSDLRVGENIFLGRLPMKSKIQIDWAKMEKDSREVLGKLGVDIDPNLYAKNLSVGQQQLVEIAKAMSFEPKVLILDEPTSALSNKECEHLFEVVRNLKKHGIIILFITHKLQELYKIADFVTVLRDGKYIGTKPMGEMRPEDIVKMMFGEIEKSEKPPSSIQDEIVLKVNNISNRKIHNINFELKKGEILGIAGMMGSGRTEVLRAIFGLDKVDSGDIIVRNKLIKSPSPETMKKLGVGFTSENRKEEALCLNLSIADNLCLASIYDISSKGKINKKKEKLYVDRQIEAMSIKVNTSDARTDSMSGGNQQKIVVGNWLNTSPGILLMDEPSRGIDVKAKQQIFNIIWEAAKNGVSIIMVSSDLEEVLGVCDRVLIMRYGEIHAELQASELTVESIYSQCMREDDIKCLNV